MTGTVAFRIKPAFREWIKTKQKQEFWNIRKNLSL